MGLADDQSMIIMEDRLNAEREEILKQKRQLLQDFRSYALKKLKEMGKPIDISYSTVNDSETLKFADLNIGDDINIEIKGFKFDPKTDMITDYFKKVFSGKKQVPDFDQNVKLPGNTFSRKLISPHLISQATECNVRKINEAKEKRVNNILSGIFSGQLVFDDDEYRALVTRNRAIAQELSRLDTRIQALNIINSQSFSESPKTK